MCVCVCVCAVIVDARSTPSQTHRTRKAREQPCVQCGLQVLMKAPACWESSVTAGGPRRHMQNSPCLPPKLAVNLRLPPNIWREQNCRAECSSTILAAEFNNLLPLIERMKEEIKGKLKNSWRQMTIKEQHTKTCGMQQKRFWEGGF